MKVKDIELTTRTVEVKGIMLPWEKWSTPPVFGKDGKNLTPERGEKSVLQETGEVFISLEDLYELAEQDRWDSQFGKVLLLGRDEGLALVAAGLAEQETRGGYHRTKKLQKLIDRLEGQ